MTTTRLFRNARLATMDPARNGLGIVEKGAVAAEDGRIAYAGPEADLPSSLAVTASEIIDCEGRWITPGLIDCHTHIVHAGNRAHEFELRLNGATYEEIARAGGGILSTVNATRAASEAELVASALPRLDALIAEGVTTIEVKSGYGLDRENEAKMLRAATHLAAERDVSIVRTFLGAHALPPEFAGDKDAYIEDVCRNQLPFVAKEHLADAVDGFCERIAFSPEQIARVFDAARAHGLPVKLHAEQLSNLGGAALAARYGALSADHLEYLDETGVAAMSKSGTVAVLLPGAFYFLKETQKPPVALLRRAGVPIAIATDCNPGSSPLTSLLLTLNMACTLFALTPDETLLGVTRNAAKALGLQREIGTLEAGKRCDLAIWEIDRPAELAYRIGFNPLWRRVRNGQWQSR
jgi:imidazolonepropionase